MISPARTASVSPSAIRLSEMDAVTGPVFLVARLTTGVKLMA